MNTDASPPEGTEPRDSDRKSSFEAQAEQKSVGLLREFWAYLRENKKWWLTPIILVLLLVGALILLGLSLIHIWRCRRELRV